MDYSNIATQINTAAGDIGAAALGIGILFLSMTLGFKLIRGAAQGYGFGHGKEHPRDKYLRECDIKDRERLGRN